MSNVIDISVSSILDAPDAKEIRTSIFEFSQLIADTSIFNQNTNKDDIRDLMVNILEDLYITEPEEVINFVNQQPSKKFIINLFSQYGIDEKYFTKIPEILRTKTAYLLAQLFESKGSNLSFDFFNEIISEFYNNLNFYNLRVEQRQLTNKYERSFPVRAHYTENDGRVKDSYNISEQDALTFIDSDLKFKIYHKIYNIYNNVEYKIKFYPEVYDASTGIEWKLPYPVKIQLNYTDVINVPRGETEVIINLKKYDINDELTLRDENQLKYKLEPVLINDPRAIIDEIDPSDLRTSKYLMQTTDYFDEDTWNASAKNVFPIVTNVLFIQFATSDTMDTMEYYPDLVRMFALTSMQDNTYEFKINNLSIKIPIAEYMNLLTFIKLKEVQVSNPGWYYGQHEFVGGAFSTFLFPKSRLEEIYKLILYYKDMPHDYEIFKEFKRRLSLLTDDASQIKTTSIFNITQFSEYLSGNIPDTFAEFFLMLEEYYPDNVNIIAGQDQNKILKEKVNDINTFYTPANPQELFNLIAIHDKEYIGLNNSLYDMLKENFIDKYPRVVQAIEAIDNRVEFTELFLDNYKRMLAEVQKMDNLVTYFVNDTFKRFILDQTFKENFFDPILNLFQNYFFKAELSYQNSDTLLYVVKDKMQQVVLGDDLYSNILTKPFSELNLKDNYTMHHDIPIVDQITQSDTWAAEIFDSDNNTLTIFDENVDNTYKNYNA